MCRSQNTVCLCKDNLFDILYFYVLFKLTPSSGSGGDASSLR